MRILAVADLHYSLPQLDWVLENAPDFDVVVLAGDLLELASLVDRRAQSVVVRKYFSRLRAVTRLVICSGNHDPDAPQRYRREGRQMAWRSADQRGSPPTATRSFSTTLCSPSARGGMARSPALVLRHSSPKPRRRNGSCGSGFITPRRTNRRSAGAARDISATANLRSGSSNTGQTSWAVCINRP